MKTDQNAQAQTVLFMLLFALFVVLFGMSKVDPAKFKAASKGIRAAVGSSSADKIFGLDPMERSRSGGADLGSSESSSASRRERRVQKDLDELHAQLADILATGYGAHEAKGRARVLKDPRGLLIKLATRDMYPEGQVEMAEDLLPLLDQVGSVLKQSGQDIRVEGHADLGESKLEGIPGLWELSSARASWVAKRWIKKFELNPERIGIEAYSRYRPVSKEDPEGARAANRRVEIVVLARD